MHAPSPIDVSSWLAVAARAAISRARKIGDGPTRGGQAQCVLAIGKLAAIMAAGSDDGMPGKSHGRAAGES